MRRYRARRAAPGHVRAALRLAAVLALAAPTLAAAGNPFSLIGETFSDWKDRLFGRGRPTTTVVNAPASGPVMLRPGHPLRVRIDANAPQSDFAKGRSRYRVIELPEYLEHAALRVQVVAEDNPDGRGHAVFKPFLYVLNEDDSPRAPIEVTPLHLDIRPFRRTRLLGCTTLDGVRRFVVTTQPDAIGKSYEEEVRAAVTASSRGGFYYSTDAVKIKLPYAATGTLILDVSVEREKGAGC
ncbi:MAG TPA: hypothetical protein VGC30_01180 [Dokdonella sp.]